MNKGIDGFKFIKEPDERIEKIKHLRTIHQLEEYDLYFNNGSFLFFDVIGLFLYKITCKRNLMDSSVMEDLIKIYEYRKYVYRE